MSFKKLEYLRSWENSADFPTLEESETKVRQDLQYHPNVIRDHINELVDELNGQEFDTMLRDSDVGVPGGVASLDEKGRVPESQLPGSYIGMESFNDRSGKVLPQKGDYTDAQVSASPETAARFGLGEDATAGEVLGVLSEAPLVKKLPRYREVSLGGLAAGTEITLNENGVPTEFILAAHNFDIELNGSRVLLVRKYLPSTTLPFSTTPMWTYDGTNMYQYKDGELDVWLNTDYKERFDRDVQEAMGTTKIRYTEVPYKTNVVIERSVFALSATELGQTSNSTTAYAAEGYAVGAPGGVSLVSATVENGGATGKYHWTRTVTVKGGTNFAGQYAVTSNNSYSTPTGSNYVRPAFTLPADYGRFLVNRDGKIMQEQEYDYDLFDANGRYVGDWQVGDVKASTRALPNSRWGLCNGALVDAQMFPELFRLMKPAGSLRSLLSERFTPRATVTNGDIIVCAGTAASGKPAVLIVRRVGSEFKPVLKRLTRSEDTSVQVELYGLAYHNGVWVATGHSTASATSGYLHVYTATDPYGEWTDHVLTEASMRYGVVASDGEHVVVIARDSSNMLWAFVSTDPAVSEWESKQVSTVNQGSVSENRVSDISFIEGYWVVPGEVSGGFGLYWAAEPLGEWESVRCTRPTNYSFYPQRCYYHDGVFFITCVSIYGGSYHYPALFYTKDRGETWALKNVGTSYSRAPASFTYAGGTWYALCHPDDSDDSMDLMYADDPLGTWTQHVISESGAIYGSDSGRVMCSFGDAYVAFIYKDSDLSPHIVDNLRFYLPSFTSDGKYHYIRLKE